ncbi:hypothetical protein [Mesorhizobium sp.]|uniref:M23 family metallopeptidase n=1 Tax=Mesorhizobium sp. TaxID=1871066 RepID=UPI000FE5FCEB|nr:hypothetical protein [Mesorhizobium sp.]RWQ57834.1 MAG: hypothetical protein EOS84_04675 [Mesorhizobium sp.]
MRAIVAKGIASLLAICVANTSYAQNECESELAKIAEIPGALDECLKADTFKPKRIGNEGAPPTEAVMTYAPVVREIAGKRRCQFNPSLATYTPADPSLTKILDLFPKSVFGHDIINPRITGIWLERPNRSGGFNTARVNGRVTIQLRFRYGYPCVHGWKLKWCHGWTLLYSYTPGWTAFITPVPIAYETANSSDKDFTRKSLVNGKYESEIVPNPSQASPHRGLVNSFIIDVPPGSSRFDLQINNDIVKVVEFLVNAFGEVLKLFDAQFEGKLSINHEQFRKFDIDKIVEDEADKRGFSEDVYFIRDVIRERVGNLTSPHTSKEGKKESTTLTALLDNFAGSDVDFSSGTHTGIPGRHTRISYSIDPDRLLERAYSEVLADPLSPIPFCASTKKGVAEELRQILEGSGASALVDDKRAWAKYEAEGRALFEKGNLSLTIEQFRTSRKIDDSVPITREDVADFVHSNAVALNFSTVSYLKEFLELSGKEIECVEKRVLERSGNINLVYPGENFGSCLLDKGLSPAQQKAIEKLDADLSAQGFWTSEISASATLVPPINNAQLRGWYYCYRQRGLCGSTANNMIRWDPKMSTFGGRPGGKHSGVDVFDTNHSNGKSQIRSVAAGKAFYRNVGDWGHTLFLPFRLNGKDYYSVYAHLDARARGLDGKIFRQNEVMYTTGCSGNAGDGQGLCNDYCMIGGVYRTDEHLHFEVLDRSTANKPIDPKLVLPNWIPASDESGKGNKICSECKNGNCIPSGSSYTASR